MSVERDIPIEGSQLPLKFFLDPVSDKIAGEEEGSHAAEGIADYDVEGPRQDAEDETCHEREEQGPGDKKGGRYIEQNK